MYQRLLVAVARTDGSDRAVLDAAEVPVATDVRHDADLIVMGTRGRGALGHLFLGSTTSKVLHLAERPAGTLALHLGT